MLHLPASTRSERYIFLPPLYFYADKSTDYSVTKLPVSLFLDTKEVLFLVKIK